jgi:membrane-bound lytic murein transglycosylase A
MKMTVQRVVMMLALVLAGCGQVQVKPPTLREDPRFTPIAFMDLPGWSRDDVGAALNAFRKSCATFLKAPAARWMTDRSVGGHVGDWVPACRALPKGAIGHDTARAYFMTWFRPYRVSAGVKTDGLFTGYFEPNLRGARRLSNDIHVPIYRRPDDLVLVTLGDWRQKLRGERIAGRVMNGRLKPYHSRAEIESGALATKGEPLVWVDDPVDAFFLHIQGSGRVVFADGSVMRVGYDGHNGHVYHAIGRDLIKAGEIAREDISLQSIRAWLNDHPDRMVDALNRNPSYIFFREVKGEGPVGAQGVPLTPGRSLAVDPKIVPLGAPVWVTADYLDESGNALRRLMVAQDTGGAIRGAVRGDVFWGHGDKAGALAGPMKAPGQLYVLLPKTLTVETSKR